MPQIVLVFDWGSAPDPAGGATMLLLISWGNPLPILLFPQRIWRLDVRTGSKHDQLATPQVTRKSTY